MDRLTIPFEFGSTRYLYLALSPWEKLKRHLFGGSVRMGAMCVSGVTHHFVNPKGKRKGNVVLDNRPFDGAGRFRMVRHPSHTADILCLERYNDYLCKWEETKMMESTCEFFWLELTYHHIDPEQTFYARFDWK